MTTTNPDQMSSNQPNTNLFGVPPPLLHLVEKPGRGRALITTAPVKPGQIIMVDTPLMVYPASLSCLSIFCCCCFRELPLEPFHCPSCHVACFCSAQCLSLSHPRLLCHALPSLSSDNAAGHEDLLFLLSAYSLPYTKFLQLLSLHSDSRFSDESMDILHSKLASLLLADIVPPHFSSKNTCSLISMEKNKSFTLFGPIDPRNKLMLPKARAYGVYLWASILNHDCMPNVCGFQYVDNPNEENNTGIIFRALHEIKEGSEICTSYVGLAGGYQKRQKRLMEVYGFNCNCERCKIESQRNQPKEESEEETEEEIELYSEEETGEEIELYSEEEEESEGKIEEETEEEIEEKNEEVEVEGGGEPEMSEGSDGSSLIGDYIERYMCVCGGLMAPMPPSEDGVVSNLQECSGCHDVKDIYSDDSGYEDRQAM